MAARPASRAHSRPGSAADVPARPAVRDFSRGATFDVEWDVRSVYDFIFSLSADAGSTDDLPAADRTWLTDARAALPRAARAASERLFANEAAIHIASFAVDRAEIRSPAEFVAALESATPGDVLRSIFSGTIREPNLGPLIERVADGDQSALPDAIAALPEWKHDNQVALLRDPAATQGEAVIALRAWLERFVEIEPRVVAMLDRDYALRAGDRGTLRGPDLIEKTTNGIRWLGEPGVRRAILAPSYFSRPYNFLIAGNDWQLFGYPIADDALDVVDALAPPQSVVRLHRALGDETRLRILKLLASRDLYLTEIANQLELSKPTIKHHLALLRAAGLVTVTESATVMYYSLRRPRLDDATSELQGFLAGSASARPSGSNRN